MLTSSNENPLLLCDYITSNTELDYWYKMTSNNGWIFSIKEESTFHIYCINRTSFTTNISGVGILQISPFCRFENEEVILLGDETKEISHVYRARSSISDCNLNNINHLNYPLIISSILILANIFSVIIILLLLRNKLSKPNSKRLSTNTHTLLTQDSIELRTMEYDVPKNPRYIYDSPRPSTC